MGEEKKILQSKFNGRRNRKGKGKKKRKKKKGKEGSEKGTFSCIIFIRKGSFTSQFTDKAKVKFIPVLSQIMKKKKMQRRN